MNEQYTPFTGEISIKNVTKTFGHVRSLDDVTATIRQGSIFGLIGSNGAGKSTLLRIMAGIYRPDAGSVSYDGEDIWENTARKQDIVYLSDDQFFFTHVTIEDMARYYRQMYINWSDEKYDRLRSVFNLETDRKISTFSKGMQKQASVLLALSCCPKYLLCDETFDGLDPVMRDSFKRVLSEETVDRGLITVLAGHNQQEMEDICDSVGFLHEGRLVCSGDLDTLLGDVHRVQLIPTGEADDSAFASLHPLRLQRQGRLCLLTLRGDRAKLEQALDALHPLFMEFLPLSLEEVFILEMEDRGYAQQ